MRPWTISVPEAGARLGLKSKDSAYQAAAKGQIPTIRVGKLLRVPVATFERMLGVEPSGAQPVADGLIVDRAEAAPKQNKKKAQS